MSDEVEELLDSLLAIFEMDTGYPSLQVHTDDGPVWGVVPDDLALILERIFELRNEED